MLDDGVGGPRGSNGGRGIGSSDIGSSEGGRPFGGGRGMLVQVNLTTNMRPGNILYECLRSTCSHYVFSYYT